MVLLTLLTLVGQVAAANSSQVAAASSWKLSGAIAELDGPGSGRYTQIRVDIFGWATIVWNGKTAHASIRTHAQHETRNMKHYTHHAIQ